MKRLKEVSAEFLCRFGKYSVGKSLTLGMYDFDVPAKLKNSVNIEDTTIKKSDFYLNGLFK